MKITYLSAVPFAILSTILNTLILTSASPTPSALDFPTFDILPQGFSPQLHHRDLTNPPTTSLSPSHTPTTTLTTRQHRPFPIVRLRVMTTYLAYSSLRLYALVYPERPPSKSVQSLKRFYTSIRRSALNEWSKLPEKSYIRIVCGQIILVVLPPADRTVPWTALEEIAHVLLLLLTAGGMGGAITGHWPVAMATGLVWLYVGVVAPVSEEAQRQMFKQGTGVERPRPPAAVGRTGV